MKFNIVTGLVRQIPLVRILRVFGCNSAIHGEVANASIFQPNLVYFSLIVSLVSRN